VEISIASNIPNTNNSNLYFRDCFVEPVYREYIEKDNKNVVFVPKRNIKY
jgi:hypothetical protein